MIIKHVFRPSLLLLFALTMVFGLQAQPQGGPPLPKEKLETLRIAFFSERLNLSPEEAQSFWPVYNAFSEEMGKVHEERRALARQT